MTQATGSAGKIILQREETWGVKPAVPKAFVLKNALYGETLGAESDVLMSEAISSDIGIQDTRNGQLRVTGTMPFELSIAGSEFLLEGALGGVEQTDVVVNTKPMKKKLFFRKASLPTWFIQKQFTDIDKNYGFLGAKFSNLTMAITAESLITGNIDIVAREVDTSEVYDLSPLELTHHVYAAIDGEILEGGLGAKYTSMNLTIARPITDPRIVGSKLAASLPEGKGEVTGDVTIMFENNDMYEKWQNETETSIKATFTQGDDSIEVLIPRVKFGGNAVAQLTSADGISVTYSFTGLVGTYQGKRGDVFVTVINEFDYMSESYPT